MLLLAHDVALNVANVGLANGEGAVPALPAKL